MCNPGACDMAGFDTARALSARAAASVIFHMCPPLGFQAVAINNEMLQ
jgi:hypothetical protein